jgi:hypothetical protein
LRSEKCGNPDLEPYNKLNKLHKTNMKDFAIEHGKCDQQRSVRQEFTMFKASYLPPNIYQIPVVVREKIDLKGADEDVAVVAGIENMEDDENVSVNEELNDHESDAENTIDGSDQESNASDSNQSDQISEYDTSGCESDPGRECCSWMFVIPNWTSN